LFAGAAIQGLLLHEANLHQQHYANAVLHLTSGRPMSYDDLVRDPTTQKLWSGAMTKELVRLSQGINGLTEGTNTVF
jgi:hypothetical protein